LQLRPLREPRVRAAGGPRRGLGGQPGRGQADVARRDRDPEPGRARHFPVRHRKRRGRAQACRGRADPTGRVVRAGPDVAHPGGSPDGSRPRGALGGGVVGAASRRLDRHRLGGRHAHLRRRSHRPRLALRAIRWAAGRSRDLRRADPPVRPRPADRDPVRQVSGRPAAWRPGRIARAPPPCRRRDLVLCPRLASLPCLADFAWHLTLPALTLGLVGAAGTARYQRAALLEVVRQDFVRTARAKGLPERRVLLVHALRNALLPLITLFGLTFPFLLTGAVLVETVFAWPGMGRLAVTAILQRDY